MQISYKPLWHTLLEKGMSKEDLRTMAKLSTNAIANMGKNKNVSMSTLLKICRTTSTIRSPRGFPPGGIKRTGFSKGK